MSATMHQADYWRAVATALQGIITQSAVVQFEHRAPVFVCEYVGTGVGAPRFMATTSSEPGDGWRMVARVGTDGTVTPAGGVA
ncbi:hypothetical protein M3D00_14370 [Dietzia cinnamea]|uniref:hypothetical protein n=1 Tax=Dietzia cinnamea TaxID=321318 RepID=UPI0021A2BD7A|nr:hypothetical protein [Dietzia cinnamea]MCT2031325.1 hypothetical protein [Dietzia cinnamea]